MAVKTETQIIEDTLLEKAQKELEAFISEKSKFETALNEELAKAKSIYDASVEEIKSKYNITELEDKIKRHTYFTKLLKGEVSFPEDLEASRRKNKQAESTDNKQRVTDWAGKISAALKKIGKTVADNPKPATIRTALNELYPNLQFKENPFNSAWNNYKANKK